ncbi:MAG: nitroreductase family protein [Candidatus Bathyarchaeia archaeon]
MNTFEAIQKRHSIRAYESTPLPEEKLMKILEAGRLAPSAGNIQPWHFIVVRDTEKRERLAKTRWAKFLAEAPVVIVGCGDQKASPKWFTVDVAIAMENIVLAATSEGLGTCWVGSFNEDEVKKLLKIPEKYRVVALLAVGYPREKLNLTGKILHLVRRRKKLSEIVSFEEFGSKSTNL